MNNLENNYLPKEAQEESQKIEDNKNNETEKNILIFKEKIFKNKEFTEKSSPEVIEYLKNAPIEIFESLSKKQYYHVTNKKFLKSILENGLTRDAQIIDKEDLDLFINLFSKYGKNEDVEYLNHYILGKNDNRAREIYVSCAPLHSNYQIPEKLKFFMTNLRYLSESNNLEEAEKIYCKKILDKYLDNLREEKDATIVLSIDSSHYKIINEIIGPYDLQNTPHDFMKKIIDHYNDVNIGIDDDINPEYIKIHSTRDSSYKQILDDINRNFMIIFK